MQTVTVVATRPATFGVSDVEMLIGSAVVIALLAWMVLARMRRQRDQKHA